MRQPTTPSPKPTQGIASGNEAATDIVRAILNGDTNRAMDLVARANIGTIVTVLSTLQSLGVTGKVVQAIQKYLGTLFTVAKEAEKLARAAIKAKESIPTSTSSKGHKP